MIDWDNAALGLPEMDLVKMFYWTRYNGDGLLGHSRPLFEKFLSGYQNPWSKLGFRLARIWWLLRVMFFERQQEADRAAVPGYPRSPYYEAQLKQVLDKKPL